MRFAIAAFLSAVSLAAGLEATQAPASTLRFSWPPEVSMLVESEHISQTLIEGQQQRLDRLRMQHRMRVAPHPEGLAIEHGAHRYLDSTGDARAALTNLLPLWVPRMIVRTDGSFVRIENAERTEALLRAMYEPLANGPMARDYPAFRDFVNSMAQGNALAQAAASEWRQMASQWIGASLDGPPVETPTSLPIAPGLQVAAIQRQQVVSRQPCAAGTNGTADCVTIEIRRAITDDGLAVLRAFILKGATAAPPRTPLSSELAETITAEVNTLLPREIVISRNVRQRAMANGQTFVIEDQERRTMRYTYDQPLRAAAEAR